MFWRTTFVSGQRLQKLITTTSQSESCVLGASRSFHYWKWRPLPWLVNPGSPAMNPHTEGRKQAPITLIKQWKEKGGIREGKQPLSRVSTLETQMIEESADNVNLNYSNALWSQNPVESWRNSRYKRHWLALLVVNSIKLHSTVFKESHSRFQSTINLIIKTLAPSVVQKLDKEIFKKYLNTLVYQINKWILHCVSCPRQQIYCEPPILLSVLMLSYLQTLKQNTSMQCTQ